MHLLHLFLYDTISLITILNPLAAAAVMLSLTEPEEVKSVSGTASFTVFIALVTTMLVGETVLKLFGINLPSIKAIGGVVLLVVSLNMIQGNEITPTKHTAEESSAASQKENIAIVPMAIPIIFGPGAITTVIVLNTDTKVISEKITLFASIVISYLVIFLTLRYAKYISNILGVHGMKIATRIVGIIIGAIAMNFLINGIKGIWM